MEISITLNKFPMARLGDLIAFLHGTTAAIAVTTPNGGNVTSPSTNDDDETGDTPVVAGTVDKNGLPHDNRIHSEPAKLTNKGVWRARRGVDPQTVAAVEAELRARAASGGGGGGTMPPAAIPPQQPAPAIFPPNAGYPPIPGNVQHNPEAAPGYVPPQQPAPVAQPQPAFQPPPQQPAPVAQPQLQAPAANGSIDFPTFMAKLQGLLQARGGDGQPLVTAEYLASVTTRVAQAFGMQANAITDLQHNPQALQYATQLMASEGRWF